MTVEQGARAPAAGEPSDPPARRDSLRIGILFLVFTVGLYLLRLWPPVNDHVIVPFTRFVAAFTGFLLGMTGADVARSDTVIRFGGVSLNLLEECNGVPAFLVFMAAILAYPARLRARGIGLLLGLPALFLVNEIRVLSLFFAYEYGSPRLFEVLHVYVWQIAIILVAVLLWLYWADRVVRGTGTKDSAP